VQSQPGARRERKVDEKKRFTRSLKGNRGGGNRNERKENQVIVTEGKIKEAGEEN